MALDTVFSFNQQGIYSRGLQSQNFTFGFFSSTKYSKKTKTIITSQLDYTFICLNFISILFIFFNKNNYALLMCYKITVWNTSEMNENKTFLRWVELTRNITLIWAKWEPHVHGASQFFSLYSLPLSWSLLAVDIQINNVVACFEY